MKTDQIKLWQTEFGDEYALRNSPDDQNVKLRTMFWENMLKNMYFHGQGLPASILEIGAGTGINLMGINAVYLNTSAKVDLFATEVNEQAKEALTVNVPSVKVIDHERLGKYPNIADMAFTSGVLIHINPAHRLELMRNMYNASRRYILAIEYFAPETREIPYRGENNALWLDDYGSLWLNNFNLRVVSYGFCWKPVTGLDNVTYWLLEKLNS